MIKAHLLSEKIPPTDFVGGIFPKKYVSIIAAKAGVGKTWYLLKLMVDLSNGGTIFNSQAFYQRPSRSVLFCGETGYQMVLERCSIMADKPNFNNIFLFSALEAQKEKQFFNVGTVEGVENIKTALRGVGGAELIAFDTLMSFHFGDENKAADMNIVMANLQNIAEEFNAAVICTHHLRKGQQGEKQKANQDEIVGSSILVRQCGSAYVLQRLGEFSYRLKAVKTWWKTPNPTTYRMLNKNGLVYFDYYDPDENITSKRLLVEKYIKEATLYDEFTAKELCEKFNCPHSTVYRVLENLCEKSEKAGYYRKK